MKNWRKYRNFRKSENSDGSFTYTITIDGEKIEVSEEIYKVYAEGGYKMENMDALKNDRVLKDAKGNAVRDGHGNAIILPEREVSLDKLIDEDWDFPSAVPSPEDTLFLDDGAENSELYRCISLLTDDEIALIKALYFENMTERAYSLKTGIAQKTINYRKQMIHRKLKNFFTN